MNTIRRISLGLGLCLMFVATASAYDRGHVYIDGTVRAVSREEITIGSHTYELPPDCKVLIQYRERGAFKKKRAPLHEVRVGDSVYAKKMGNRILEIEIERWTK